MHMIRNTAAYREEGELIKPVCRCVVCFQNVSSSAELKKNCLKEKDRVVHGDVFFET